MIKRLKQLICGINMIALLFLCGNTYTSAIEVTNNPISKKTNNHNNKEKSRIKDNYRYVTDEIIVKFKLNKGKNIRSYDIYSKYNVNMKHELKDKNIKVLKISKGENLEEVIERLNKDDNVEVAQPNYIYYPQEVTGGQDEYEWVKGYENSQNNITTQHIEQENSNYTIIGVIDSGVDINHPYLKKYIWTNKKEIPNNNIDDDGNGYVDDINGWDFYNKDNTVIDLEDGDEHGTHVAGIVLNTVEEFEDARYKNNIRIMPIKFIGPDGGSTLDAIEAIKYARNKGAKVINCSWGGNNKDILLKEVIEESQSLFVTAAGNMRRDIERYPNYPSSFKSDNILAVAAVDKDDIISYFSNYGVDSVDVGAKGNEILSTVPKRERIGAAVKFENDGYKIIAQGFGLERLDKEVDRFRVVAKVLNELEVKKDEPILIVDDSDSYNIINCYKDALLQLGFMNSQVVNVRWYENGPDEITMGKYKLVIWFTGNQISRNSGYLVTKQDQSNIINYLNNGGRLYLSGSQAIYDIYDTELCTSYLRTKWLHDEAERKYVLDTTDGSVLTLLSGGIDCLKALDHMGEPFLYYDGEVNYDTAYKNKSGTSMAAPMVSGIAALIMNRGVEEINLIKNKIMQGTIKNESLNGKSVSGGVVFVNDAFKYTFDLNNDKIVDLKDIQMNSESVNTKRDEDGWNPVLDSNKDGYIDIFDIVDLSKEL